jgi:hypothetical protein
MYRSLSGHTTPCGMFYFNQSEALKEPNMNNPQRQLGVNAAHNLHSSEGALPLIRGNNARRS